MGLPYNRVENGAEFHLAVGPKRNRRRMGQFALCGIRDDAKHDEGQRMRLGELGRDVGFHIDSKGAGRAEQLHLGRDIGDDRVRTGNSSKLGVGQPRG